VYHCKLNIPQKADRGPSFAFYETIMSYLPVTAPFTDYSHGLAHGVLIVKFSL